MSSILSNEPLAQNVNSELLSKVTNHWHKTSVVKSSKSFGHSHIWQQQTTDLRQAHETAFYILL